MTIEEAKAWEQAFNDNMLPVPKGLNLVSNENIEHLINLQGCIICLMSQDKGLLEHLRMVRHQRYDEDYDSLKELNWQVEEWIKQNFLVFSFSGSGTKQDPYEINTMFGKGKFYRCEEEFTNQMSLSEHKDFYNRTKDGFTVSINLARDFNKAGITAEQSTGLIWLVTSNLYPVVLLKNKHQTRVLDFAMNMVMDYELYKSIFCYEQITSNTGLKISKTEDLVLAYFECAGKQVEDITPIQFAMAYEDIVRMSEVFALSKRGKNLLSKKGIVVD